MRLDAAPAWSFWPFRFAGHLGSRALTEAFAPIPCGCDRVNLAARETDLAASRLLRTEGEKLQARWRCPFAGYPLSATVEHLDTTARVTLRVIGLLTGFTEAKTCPCYYSRQPDVQRAVQAKRWRDKGQLHLIDPEPPSTLVEAIDCVDWGEGECISNLHKSSPSHSPDLVGPIESPEQLPRRRGPAWR